MKFIVAIKEYLRRAIKKYKENKMNDEAYLGGGQPGMSPLEKVFNLLRYVPREYLLHINENGWVLQYPKFRQGNVIKDERSFQTIDALLDFVRIHERDLSAQQKGLSSIVRPVK